MSKKALVTGGTKGLGRALVDLLVDDGWDVISLDRDEPKDKKGFTPIKADLSDRKIIDQLPKKLKNNGPFDLVIFNAGISATGKFEEMPYSAYEKLLCLNSEGPMVLASQFAQLGLMNDESRMVFVSSLSHFTGYPGAAVYSASKDTIAIYAKSIFKPFRKLGIHVSCVFPGPLKTEHAEKYSPSNSSDAKRLDPLDAAKIILDGVYAGKKRIFTSFGNKVIAMAGKRFPLQITFIMKKALFEKLDKNTF